MFMIFMLYFYQRKYSTTATNPVISEFWWKFQRIFMGNLQQSIRDSVYLKNFVYCDIHIFNICNSGTIPNPLQNFKQPIWKRGFVWRLFI